MAIETTATVRDISRLLRGMGEEELAERLDYLASDADLEPGESPATDESARGLLGFLCAVQWDGEFGLACSPEGWIVGEWRFDDKRRASVWFLDDDQVMFTAKNKRGAHIAIGERRNFSDCCALAKVFVQEGILSWRPSNQST